MLWAFDSAKWLSNFGPRISRDCACVAPSSEFASPQISPFADVTGRVPASAPLGGPPQRRLDREDTVAIDPRFLSAESKRADRWSALSVGVRGPYFFGDFSSSEPEDLAAFLEVLVSVSEAV